MTTQKNEGDPPPLDPAVEKWLREEVIPGYLAYKADPTRGIPIEEVRRRFQERTHEWASDEPAAP